MLMTSAIWFNNLIEELIESSVGGSVRCMSRYLSGDELAFGFSPYIFPFTGDMSVEDLPGCFTGLHNLIREVVEKSKKKVYSQLLVLETDATSSESTGNVAVNFMMSSFEIEFVAFAMKNKSRSSNNNSLCEKSMKMVTNVIRLSSFSIARMSLGITTQPAPSSAGNVPASYIKGSPTARFPESSLRSQEPVSIKKPIAYLIDPTESGKSSSLYAVNEKSIDGRASDYIRRVHEKNRQDSNEAMSFSAFMIPPPPRLV